MILTEFERTMKVHKIMNMFITPPKTSLFLGSYKKCKIWNTLVIIITSFSRVRETGSHGT